MIGWDRTLKRSHCSVSGSLCETDQSAFFNLFWGGLRSSMISLWGTRNALEKGCIIRVSWCHAKNCVKVYLQKKPSAQLVEMCQHCLHHLGTHTPALTIPARIPSEWSRKQFPNKAIRFTWRDRLIDEIDCGGAILTVVSLLPYSGVVFICDTIYPWAIVLPHLRLLQEEWPLTMVIWL